MKIRVTTDKYEYQGLKEGSIHKNASDSWCSGNYRGITFTANGKIWYLTDPMFEVVEEDEDDFPAPNEKLLDVINTDLKQQGPIKSDGGSSSYYDLPVAEWLLYTLNERQKEGKCYIKTEEMINAFFGNDFDRGNIIKSLVRCQGLQDGTGGKAGNSVEYECNKMIYSVNKIKEKK